MLKIKKIILFSISFCFFVFTSSCKSNTKEIIVNSDNLKVIQIASASPLSGDLKAGGISIKNGAKLAIENKIETFKKLGYVLEFLPFDDKADAATGIDVANQIVNNKNILAVVGHYNSGVTLEASEIYNKYNLVMVSPASTAVQITARNYNNINRIVAKDDDQGSVAAKFSIDELGVKKAFLINDGTEYGVGITDEFKKSYEKFGGKVTNNETIKKGQANFDSEFAKLKKSKAEVLYFGGMYPEAINILKQIHSKKIDIKFIGADGIDAPEIISSVGNSAKGIYYTTTAGDISDTNIGIVWLSRYENKFEMAPNNYSVYGYDATDVILKSILELIKENKNEIPKRDKISQKVRKTKNFNGLSANITFDENGDNTESKIFIYKYEELIYPADLVAKVNVGE